MTELLLMGVVGEEVAKPETDWLLGLGVVLFLAGATAAWASLHLRSKTYERLNSNIDITFVKLTDRAIIELRILRDHLDEVLPDRSDGQDDDDEPFEPLSLITDPSTVAKPAKRGIKVLKERHVIHRQFDWMLMVCTLFKIVALAFPAFVLLSSLSYYFYFENSNLWLSLCKITAAIAVAAVVLLCAYGVLESKIQHSIEESQRTERPAGAAR